jgi:transcriptional regulator with XRE-family HTH domain
VPIASPEPLARRVGRRIADLRVAAQISQEEFARRLRLSDRALRSIEAGERNLTLSSLERIALALDVEAAALFEPATDERPRRVRRRRRTP